MRALFESRHAGPVLAVLIAATYFVAGRPVRELLTAHVAFPALEEAADWSPELRVTLSDERRSVQIDRVNPPVRLASYSAPGGGSFLLGALVLAALFPARPYWLILLAWHAVAGAAGLGALLYGVSGELSGYWVHRFVVRYALDAPSLVLAVLGVVEARRRRRAKFFSSA
jgi:hypothetical protein